MAATINFKKFIQDQANHVLEDVVKSLGVVVLVCDASKRPLAGDENARSLGQFPIWLSGRTIGWVMGPPKAYCVASALMYMAGQELEKKAVTAQVMDRESEINLLHEISEKISDSLDVAEIAMALVDEATGCIESTGASVMLLNDETRNLEIIAAFGKKFDDRPVLKPGVGIVGDVLLTGMPEIINDVTTDPRYVSGANKICSLICVPITTQNKIIGAVNISSNRPMNYKEPDVKLAVTLATQAASAIENAKKYEKLFQEKSAPGSFVSSEILQCLGKSEGAQVEPGDACREEMSVLFSGIRSHAEHYDTMDARENFNFLNDYLACIGPSVTQNNGFMGKCIGDGAMALFPETGKGGPDNALAAAVDMQKCVREFSEKRRRSSKMPVKIGVGVHTGPVSLGVVGFASGLESTVLGDSVTIASKLERLSKFYGLGVAISDQTFEKLANRSAFGIREVDMVQIPGREKVFTVYDVYSADPEGIKDAKQKNFQAFNEALELFRHKQWEKAARILDGLHKLMPFDRVVTIYLKRCLAFLKSPPGDSWVGISRLPDA